MKKKYFVFIFVLMIMLSNFVFINNVSAKLKYNSDDKYDCDYRSEDGKKAGIFLEGNTFSDRIFVHYDEDRNGSDTIMNWVKAFKGTTTSGQTYVKFKSCPKYLLYYVTGWTHKQYFAIAAEGDLVNVYNAISKEEDGTVKKIYHLLQEEKPKEEEETKVEYSSCMDFTRACDCDKSYCTGGSKSANEHFSCIWNEEYNYCNVDSLQFVACGDARDIPYQLPEITSFLFNLLKIAVPIILVIVSMITLVKAVVSSNDDATKKAQKTLVRRIIAAAIVFFVMSIVQLVISVVADVSDTESITKCMDCFLTNDCSTSKYYKSNVNGEYVCKSVGTGKEIDCSPKKED